MKDISKPLRGYVILILKLIPNQKLWSAAMPMFFNQTDTLSINSELTALSKEESKQQDKMIKDIDYSMMDINVNYDYDISSEETMHSVPNIRGYLFGINDLDCRNDSSGWLKQQTCFLF